MEDTGVVKNISTKQKIVQKGMMSVLAEYNNKQCLLDFHILEKGEFSWGHEWLKKRNSSGLEFCKILQALSKVSVETVKQQLKGILNQVSSVIMKVRGTLKHIKARIMLDEEAQTQFHKCSPFLTTYAQREMPNWVTQKKKAYFKKQPGVSGACLQSQL